jgi:hypothetical protein
VQLRPRSRLPAAATALVIAAAVAVGFLALADSRDDRSSAQAGSDRAAWAHLTSEMAAPWPALQTDEGPYRDYTDGLAPNTFNIGPGTRYGDALMGLALIQQGLREDDRELVDSGVRAMAWVTAEEQRRRQWHEPSVFETLAVPAAYNLMRERMPDHPLFERTRADWERYMQIIKPVSTILNKPETTRFSNHYLVEAIGVFELERSGVRSRNPRVLVGPGLERAVAIYTDMVNRVVPLRARRFGQRRHGREAFLLSDHPDYPLAYQGLSMGLYAQLVRMLGDEASPAAHDAVRRAANASWMITAPDGEIGWFGRSQGQGWGQAGNALGGTVAAEGPGASATDAARYRALARRSLERLRGAYANVPGGHSLIPAVAAADDPVIGARGLDPYAGAPSFTALTLLQLQWMLDVMPADEQAVGKLAADGDTQTRLLRGRPKFAVMRSGRTWFAVRAGQSETRYPGDLRYDFGLVALKRADDEGRWRDVMPLRPITFGDRDSAGPLLYRNGVRALPWGGPFRVRRGGLELQGGFRALDGTWQPEVVRFRYTPTDCGVLFSFRGQAGDQYEYASFLRGADRAPDVTADGATDGVQAVAAEPTPTSVGVDRRRYYSSSDAELRRVRMRWRLERDTTISVETCTVGG